MCTSNPTAINNISFGIGSVGQLVGGMISGNANKDYHDANARYLEQMNEINQAYARKAIDTVKYVGGMNASAVRNKGLSLTKTQKAAMASHGVSQSATYQNILDDTITRSERDAIAIMYNADIQAQNIRTNASLQQAQYLSQAAQERAAGKIAKRAGILSAIGQFADSWSKWSQTGMAGYGGSNNWNGVNARNIPVRSYDSLYSVDMSKNSYRGSGYGSGWSVGGGSGSLWR